MPINYVLKFKFNHYEVYSSNGQFLFSADSKREAELELAHQDK
ncbi:MAG: hypothetical protein RSE36_04480 [Oscillospiraceae bacterium]